MPDRISLRRLIQQNAYLSDSTAGRQITGDFCARFQVPNGGRVRNFIHTGCDSSTENGYAVGALDNCNQKMSTSLQRIVTTHHRIVTTHHRIVTTPGEQSPLTWMLGGQHLVPSHDLTSSPP